MIVLISIGVAVGYVIGYVNTDPINELAIIFSVISIGLAIAIFVIQNEQSNSIQKLSTQIENITQKTNDVVKQDEASKIDRHIYCVDLIHQYSKNLTFLSSNYIDDMIDCDVVNGKLIPRTPDKIISRKRKEKIMKI